MALSDQSNYDEASEQTLEDIELNTVSRGLEQQRLGSRCQGKCDEAIKKRGHQARSKVVPGTTKALLSRARASMMKLW